MEIQYSADILAIVAKRGPKPMDPRLLKRLIAVRLAPESVELLRELARRHGVSQARIIEEALRIMGQS